MCRFFRKENQAGLQVCFCCLVTSAWPNGLYKFCKLPVHVLYFSTEVIAFSLIYSRFYFCFVSINSERVIFLYLPQSSGVRWLWILTFPLMCSELTGSLLDLSEIQFSSVAQWYPTLCVPMNRSTSGLPVHHKLPEFTQTHAHRVGDGHLTISSSVVSFASCPQSLPASGSFPVS